MSFDTNTIRDVWLPSSVLRQYLYFDTSDGSKLSTERTTRETSSHLSNTGLREKSDQLHSDLFSKIPTTSVHYNNTGFKEKSDQLPSDPSFFSYRAEEGSVLWRLHRPAARWTFFSSCFNQECYHQNQHECTNISHTTYHSLNFLYQSITEAVYIYIIYIYIHMYIYIYTYIYICL